MNGHHMTSKRQVSKFCLLVDHHDDVWLQVTAILRSHRVGEHDALLVQTARASGSLSNEEAQHFERGVLRARQRSREGAHSDDAAARRVACTGWSSDSSGEHTGSAAQAAGFV